jgi:putative spermidine/putrescine transport system ATP-binding protein
MAKNSAAVVQERMEFRSRPWLRVASSSPQSATEPASAKVLVEKISKKYDEVTALHAVDLAVAPGELMTILGPSGSGKTTLLQIICGLVTPTSGRLIIDNKDQTYTPVHRRDIGLVFQSYALFPHLTVSENVAFPLEMRKMTPLTIRTKVFDALDMVGLTHLADRLPSALSGGQQQRVALARCFVYQPSVILMDEPLGALDRKLRESMQIEIKRLHRDTGATIIFVTHDQEEALALSDRICVMNNARIEQVGTPREIYERPRTAFAADFVGISNIIRGRLAGSDVLEAADGKFALPRDASASGPEGALAIRPEHLTINGGGDQSVTGTVIEAVYAGSETRLLVSLPSAQIFTVRQPAGAPQIDIGSNVQLGWQAENSVFLSS